MKPRSKSSVWTIAAALAAAVVLTGNSNANAGEDSISLQLNRAQPSTAGCRLSFVMRNNVATSVDGLKLEIVLFDKNGQVGQFFVLNAGALPSGKTKVRQFDIEQQKCSEVSRVLLNDVAACGGNSLDPATCLELIRPTTSTHIEFVK